MLDSMDIIIKRKGIPNSESPIICGDGELRWIEFPMISKLGMVRHLFSTRLGGVSKGHLSSMNLSYSRGDDKWRVDENFNRIASVLGTTADHFVCTDQTHTANVMEAKAGDAGKGITLAKDYADVDGLVTNEPGLALAAFFADCVPLFFVDPRAKAIGLAHAGWRGTLAKIGKAVVEKMTRFYGSEPKDIIAAIGPSICRDCYEVDEDVASEFAREFGIEAVKSESLAEQMVKEQIGERNVKQTPIGQTAINLSPILTSIGGGKYLLDLWQANREVLLNSGLLPEHISVTDICTCCNPDFLFSHRATHGKRGNMGAFLMLG